MTLKLIYISTVFFVELLALLIGFNERPDNSISIIVPMLIGTTIFIVIMFFIHSIRIRSYLYKQHRDIWEKVTDYSSFVGNGTYNVTAYYKFLYSYEGAQDSELNKRKNLIKLFFILIPVLVVTTPINIIFVFYVN